MACIAASNRIQLNENERRQIRPAGFGWLADTALWWQGLAPNSIRHASNYGTRFRRFVSNKLRIATDVPFCLGYRRPGLGVISRWLRVIQGRFLITMKSIHTARRLIHKPQKSKVRRRLVACFDIWLYCHGCGWRGCGMARVPGGLGRTGVI